MQSLTPETTVVAAANQISCDIDDEAALLNLDTGVYYGLDAMGAYIWKLIQTPVTVSALREQLLSDYEADAAVIEADLRAFLVTMSEAGLVQLDPAST